MSKSHEPHSAATGGKTPLQVYVHVNPMYIIVTQIPPGQTISVQVSVKDADGGHSTLSIPNVGVGTTVINTSAKTEAMATELIVVADKTGPCTGTTDP